MKAASNLNARERMNRFTAPAVSARIVLNTGGKTVYNSFHYACT